MSTSLPLNSVDVADLQYTLLGRGVSFALYGIQAALFIASIPVLVRRDSWILPAVTFMLFGASTITIVGGVLHDAYTIRNVYSTPLVNPVHEKLVNSLGFVTDVFAHLNLVISDGVVLWRAWVIWPRSYPIHALLLFCGTCSLAGIIYEGFSPYTRERGLPLTIRESTEPLLAVALISTNFAATVLIGIRFWTHRRDVRAIIASYSTGYRVESILLLLLESGLVYTAYWIVSTLRTVPASFGHPLLPNSFIILGQASYLFAGVYPTFLMVMVALQQCAPANSPLGRQSEFLASLRFLSHQGGGDEDRSGELHSEGGLDALTQDDTADEIELSDTRLEREMPSD